MPQKSPPKRTLERKERESLALKANMKRRKAQPQTKPKPSIDKADQKPMKS